MRCPRRHRPRAGLTPGMLLVTSLRETAPFLLLNVSFGDAGVISDPRCGCPLEPVGWTWHLDRIRSQEKLTAGGMTFLDADVIRVLDEVSARSVRRRTDRLPAPGGERRRGTSPAGAGGPPARRSGGRGGDRPRPAGRDRRLGLGRARDGSSLAGVRLDPRAARPPRTTPSGKILHLHAPGGDQADGRTWEIVRRTLPCRTGFHSVDEPHRHRASGPSSRGHSRRISACNACPGKACGTHDAALPGGSGRAARSGTARARDSRRGTGPGTSGARDRPRAER